MPEKADDPSIGDDEIVYRRIPNVAQSAFIVVDEGTGKRRPTTAIFRPDEDGVSVYCDSILRQYKLDEKSLIRDPLNGVLSLTVGDVRAEDLGVASDAWPRGNGKFDKRAAQAETAPAGPDLHGYHRSGGRLAVTVTFF